MRPKVELTRELVDLHARLRSEGVPIDECCRIAGHGVSVWYRWKREAKAELEFQELWHRLLDACGGKAALEQALAELEAEERHPTPAGSPPRHLARTVERGGWEKESLGNPPRVRKLAV